MKHCYKKLKASCVHGLEDNMKITHKVTYRLNAIPITISMTFFSPRNQKNFNLNFIQNFEGPQQPKQSCKRKKKDLHFLISTLTKLQIIETWWYRQKDRDVDQQNRIKKPKINPHIYGQLIFNKSDKICGKRTAFSINSVLENQILTCRGMKLDLHFTPCTKINSKWIRDLNVSTRSTKLLKWKNIHDLGFGNSFSHMPRAEATKEKQIHWTLLQLKLLCIKMTALRK